MFRFTRLTTKGPFKRLTPALRLTRAFSSDLDPTNKKDYNAYVQQWKDHFNNDQLDHYELERGLNHIFAADWVPDLRLVEDVIKAARRLNSFSVAVRVLEALENKVESKSQYLEYIAHLKPLLDEYGVVEKKEFGVFETVRDKSKWWY